MNWNALGIASSPTCPNEIGKASHLCTRNFKHTSNSVLQTVDVDSDHALGYAVGATCRLWLSNNKNSSANSCNKVVAATSWERGIDWTPGPACLQNTENGNVELRALFHAYWYNIISQGAKAVDETRSKTLGSVIELLIGPRGVIA